MNSCKVKILFRVLVFAVDPPQCLHYTPLLKNATRKTNEKGEYP